MKQTEEQKKEFKRLRLSQKQSYERWYSLLTSKNEETREYRIGKVVLFIIKNCYPGYINI